MTGSSLKIASIVLGTGGVVTGLGVGIHQMSKPAKAIENKETTPLTAVPPKDPESKLITDLLKEDNLELIQNGDDEATIWKPKWKAFKAKYETIKARWEISNWDEISGQEDSTPQAFKTKCNEIGTKQKVNDKQAEIYKEISLYCTKKKSG
ncbi:hypothetical protein A6V39_01165 [Candidatus Mycoplasma haematobovis]|uniref:Uncharacterized protein n=1 Tax=Candidatus Mycoplasma haematobovis TaxID=432608 RepID=A0A1A9QDW7_9MOLU|nr:hypothetical protein [Candidatus Mycoplasma haematobovis]OAL10663.1 hypothetical protein A6V39_01165 [Candidatus Mycoplasma haematobovis]